MKLGFSFVFLAIVASSNAFADYPWVAMAFDQYSGASGTGWAHSKGSAMRTAQRAIESRYWQTGACSDGCLALAVTPRTYLTRRVGFAMRCGHSRSAAEADAMFVVSQYGRGGYIKKAVCTWDR